MTTNPETLRLEAAAWTAGTLANRRFDPTRQPVLNITANENVRKIAAAVSPDCSYRLVKEAIDAAKREICIYIYNASAGYLLDLLRAAKRRGVSIRLMYDVTDTRGDERASLATLGVELKEAPSTDGRRVFTVCHQKFAVIDESVLLLGSANWATSSIPKIEDAGGFKKANREWLVRIDEGALAKWFKGLFEADWSIPELEQPPGEMAVEVAPAVAFFAPRAPTRPEKVFDLRRVDLDPPAHVTPIISPNNYFPLMKKLILEARSSVDIEQQYILAGGPDTEGILSALRDRKGELDIRIIVSPAFRKIGDKDNWEMTMDSLAGFDLKDCLRGMNLRFYTHLHNKGVIVDRDKVVVSSTNWSENSMRRAREAGVLIESDEVASYFAEVFDFDWTIALPIHDLPANLPWLPRAALAVPEEAEEIHPADLV